MGSREQVFGPFPWTESYQLAYEMQDPLTFPGLYWLEVDVSEYWFLVLWSDGCFTSSWNLLYMIPFFDGDPQWPLSLGGVRNLSALWESCLQKGISCYLVSPKFSPQLMAYSHCVHIFVSCGDLK